MQKNNSIPRIKQKITEDEDYLIFNPYDPSAVQPA